MKQLKDYLHLYLGCEYACLYDGKYNYHGDKLTYTALYKYSGNFIIGQRFKLILRPLSDMTEEEHIEAENIEIEMENDVHNSTAEVSARTTLYFLSKHFDLFGLIEAGLAIDKTETLKPQT